MPFRLNFKKDYKTTWDYYENDENSYEASSIINKTEDKIENAQLSAIEFIDFMKQFINCADKYDCSTCVLDRTNTKCGKSLCILGSWPGNEKELIEIAKQEETTIKEKSKYEEAIDVLNAYSDVASRAPSEADFYNALNLAIEALKELNHND